MISKENDFTPYTFQSQLQGQDLEQSGLERWRGQSTFLPACETWRE